MNEPLLRLVTIAHLAATLYMTGVIWQVQLTHYPLMNRVAPERFVEFEKAHTSRMTWVVGPVMLVELVTALGLVARRPEGVATWAAGAGLALLVVIWLSTFLVQVPCHERLAEGFDEATHRRLVESNWLRTAAWSLRAALASGIVWAALAAARDPV